MPRLPPHMDGIDGMPAQPCVSYLQQIKRAKFPIPDSMAFVISCNYLRFAVFSLIAIRWYESCR